MLLTRLEALFVQPVDSHLKANHLGFLHYVVSNKRIAKACLRPNTYFDNFCFVWAALGESGINISMEMANVPGQT